MSPDEYAAACKREIEAAEKVCGKDASQAQLVGHLAGEVVRLRQIVEEQGDQLGNLRLLRKRLTDEAEELKRSLNRST